MHWHRFVKGIGWFVYYDDGGDGWLVNLYGPFVTEAEAIALVRELTPEYLRD